MSAWRGWWRRLVLLSPWVLSLVLTDLNPARALLLALCLETQFESAPSTSLRQRLSGLCQRHLAMMLLIQQLRPDGAWGFSALVVFIGFAVLALPTPSSLSARRWQLVLLSGILLPSLLGMLLGLGGNEQWRVVEANSPWTLAAASPAPLGELRPVLGDVIELPKWRPPATLDQSPLSVSPHRPQALLLGFGALGVVLFLRSRKPWGWLAFALPLAATSLLKMPEQRLIHFQSADSAWLVTAAVAGGHVVGLVEKSETLTEQPDTIAWLELSGPSPPKLVPPDAPPWVDATLRFWAAGERDEEQAVRWGLAPDGTLFRLPL